MRVEILRTDRGVTLLTEVPETRWERARGLLGRASLDPGAALLLERARSVHTIGMRFDLTIAFLDGRLQILDVVRARPGTILLGRRHARHVLEAHGTADLHPGGQVLRLP